MAHLVDSINYSLADQSSSFAMDTTLIRALDIDSAGNTIRASTPDQKFIKYDSSFPGYTYDDISTVEGTFNRMENVYNEAMRIVEIANTTGAMSRLLDNSVSSERERVNAVRSSSVNNVYKQRQTFMMTKYASYYQRFLITLLQFTIVVTIICCMVSCLTYYEKTMLSWTATGAIIGLILAIYFMLIVLFYKQKLMRRRDDWNKWYFSSPESSRGTCR
jgi:hypothetical protein